MTLHKLEIAGTLLFWLSAICLIACSGCALKSDPHNDPALRQPDPPPFVDDDGTLHGGVI